MKQKRQLRRSLECGLRNAGSLVCAMVWLMIAVGSVGADEEKALTNQEVLALVQAGMSDAIVVAKIKQASAVDFSLEVDDIVDLREQGASDAVIQTMLERDSAPATTSGVFDSAAGTTSQAVDWQDDFGTNIIRVALEEEEGAVRLRGMRGEMTSTGAFAFRFTFMDYPGLKAKHRTTSRRPTLLVRSSTPLSGGRYFLAVLDSDTDDGVRSLKISSGRQRFRGMFGSSRGLTEPDPDWVVEFKSEEIEDDVWRITPEEDLKPGEYGWYVDVGAGNQSALLFDFGVD